MAPGLPVFVAAVCPAFAAAEPLACAVGVCLVEGADGLDGEAAFAGAFVCESVDADGFLAAALASGFAGAVLSAGFAGAVAEESCAALDGGACWAGELAA